MKSTLKIAGVLIAFGAVGWLLLHRMERKVAFKLPNLKELEVSAEFSPIDPDQIHQTHQRLLETSILLKKQMLPLVQHLPEEVKRLNAMAAQHDSIRQQLSRMGTMFPTGAK